ncbi:MAG: NUDIX domain-containing protein [Oscillospiraceae bacterium]|jgi:8-oxo-dGTP pyrophosphatase MutT (NUDIX family)|nr:NUDIX domain-containing protein [Oscillospiraceae bacterium]MBQ8917641.1 NUDIX domain-containing protein [Oscillospiraceae bacterium]MBQ9108762.1 NUDIX domain-containing protein [Oscillospiraceae bacterium]
MKREKSCGAVVYRYNNDVLEVLLIRHRFGGHWSFPKGHVEEGENEFQTALREVKEETNLSIRLREGFRESVEYFPKPYIKKQVVYFLGLSLGDTAKRQEEEISELRWVPIDDAERMVSFANDKNLISRSREYLKANGPE